jgi:single-stranded DNA-binding protein
MQLPTNSVLLGGRVVGEPDQRELPNGRPVYFLRLECERSPQTTGSQDARADRFDVLMLGRVSATIAAHLHPGRPVLVQGSLESECWEEGEGSEREEVSVLAEQVSLL